GSTGTGTGSSGSGTGSTGTGTGTTGTGTGSTGTGTTGTGTTGTGSTGTGTPTTPSNPSDPATPTAVITVTSPSTVLPQESVNVQAIASSFGDGTVINSTIAWNFGDPGSAYNTLVGFNAAHAYANAGTYTITLTISTPDGHVGIATQQITIAPDNRTTIYVSSNGNDSNNGLSAGTPIQSLARLSQLLTSNMRVLFQDGDTFDMSGGNGINAGGLSHVYIGSYGSGAQPILMYTGPATQTAMIGMSGSTEGLVVQGLTFDSIYTNNQDSQAIASAFFPNGNDITISDNTFLNLLDDMNMASGPTNVLVQGNSSPNPTALNAYFSWTQGSEIVFLGNTVAASFGEAILRVGGATDLLIADNNLTNLPNSIGNGIAKNVLSIQAGGNVYVYGNTLSTGPVEAGPLGTPAADPNAAMSDVVFDSNIVLNSSILLTPGVHNVMARNNVIEGNGNAGFTIDAQEVDGAFNWQVQNVYIEHNTVTEPSVWGGLLSINDGEAQGIHIDNNLFVDPNYVTGAGAGFIKTDENDMNSFAEIKDNVWSIPASVNSWAQGGYFFESSDTGSQAGWLTPAEWEATGIPTGDVYENVNLGATYSVNVDGFTAGSYLPTT
ncbi:MAG: PKD domain-containing protein, partial [Tepidisphaeraceae bacterium]